MPTEDLKKYESVKDDDSQFAKVSVRMAIELVRRLIENEFEPICGIHFFTFNELELTNQVVREFNF